MRRLFLYYTIIPLAVIAIALTAYFIVIGRDVELADFSDLALPAVVPPPDEQNAHTFFKRAAEAYTFKHTREDGRWISVTDFFKENRTNTTLVAEVIAENEEAFRLFRRGLECERYHNPPTTNEHGAIHYDFVNNQMSFAQFIMEKARFTFDQGDTDAALRDIRDILRCGITMRRDPISLVEYLVAISTETQALSAIAKITRDPKTTPDDLRRFLEILDEVPPYALAAQNALKTEFVMTTATIKRLAAKKVHKDELSFLFGDSIPGIVFIRKNFLPNMTLNAMADYYRSIIGEIPQFYSDMALPEHSHEQFKSFYNILFMKNYLGEILWLVNVSSVWSGGIERRCQADGQLAVTKLIVACHLFQLAEGRRPATLDELVPGYLPAVPPDPFDGAPFRYNAALGVVYSVGKSLTDHGGTDPNPRERNRLQPWRAENAIFKIWEDEER